MLVQHPIYRPDSRNSLPQEQHAKRQGRLHLSVRPTLDADLEAPPPRKSKHKSRHHRLLCLRTDTGAGLCLAIGSDFVKIPRRSAVNWKTRLCGWTPKPQPHMALDISPTVLLSPLRAKPEFQVRRTAILRQMEHHHPTKMEHPLHGRKQSQIRIMGMIGKR